MREHEPDVGTGTSDGIEKLQSEGMPRRTFLRNAAAATGGAVALTIVPRLPVGAQNGPMTASPVASPIATPVGSPAASPVASPVATANYSPVVLSATEWVTLQAAVDRIVPPDELGPGAVEIGVPVYIDRALAGRSAASVPSYQQGLAALDTAAGSGGFAALSSDKQDEILKTAEAGKLANAPAGFFAMLLQDTREGMFSDPIHGGNLNFAGWDLMGYPGIKLVWTAQDQAVNATPQPEHISVAKYGGQES